MNKWLKFLFLKKIEDNLYEAQKTYEALNNQLLEELPVLIQKSYCVLDKCITVYLTALRHMNESIGRKINDNVSLNEVCCIS